jgi:hypothetical protein
LSTSAKSTAGLSIENRCLVRIGGPLTAARSSDQIVRFH